MFLLGVIIRDDETNGYTYKILLYHINTLKKGYAKMLLLAL